MSSHDPLWRVHVTKRRPKGDGTHNEDSFYGTCHNDGLQSLFSVTLADGTVRYASVLDDITWLGTVVDQANPKLATLPKAPTR